MVGRTESRVPDRTLAGAAKHAAEAVASPGGLGLHRPRRRRRGHDAGQRRGLAALAAPPRCSATCPRSGSPRPCSAPRSAAPVLIAPSAMHRFVHDEGELATARAAARFGSGLRRVDGRDDIARRTSPRRRPVAPRWAQMYMLRDRGRTRSARGAGPRRGVHRRSSPASTAPPSPVAADSRGGALVPPDWFRFPNLAAPDDPESSDLMALVSDFDPAMTFDDLACVRGVERAPGGRQGRDAGRRRRPLRRRRGRGDRGVEPRRAHARRRRRDRRGAPRGRRGRRRPGRGVRRRRASAAASTCCGRCASARAP